MIRWGLRGRCKVQKEVRSWIEHVTVRILVNNERLVVDFDVVDGDPNGTVTEIVDRGSGADARPVVLARFEDDKSFEQAMDTVMMPRLQLQPIVAWQKETAKPVSNAWEAYSAALLVSSKGLDFLLGDTAFSGMSSRLLQMFVGGAWAASRAQASTAVKATKHAITQTTNNASEHEKLLDGARERATEELRRTETALAALPPPGRQLDDVSAAVDAAATLGRQLAELRMQLEDAEHELRLAQRELDEERHRRHAVLEDALARRFFNALRPTSCPRCAAPVTAQRRAQEAQGHTCSVCTHDLDLDAYQHEMIVAVDAPDDERQAAMVGAALLRAGNGASPAAAPVTGDSATEPIEEPAVDTEAALTQVVQEWSGRVSTLRGRLRPLEEQRTAAIARTHVAPGGAGLDRRREAEMAVAVARGAVQALAPLGVSRVTSDLEALREKLKVLTASEKITAQWTQDAQKDPLDELSKDITRLTRDFGVSQLLSVKLDGGARMRIEMGGQVKGYSECDPTAQMRLKVATAIALLHRGFDTGVGRHPGLLMVDAPGTEETYRDNLATMLNALRKAAKASPEMQVFVATTAVDALEQVVDADHRRIAGPGDYVW